MSGFAAAQLLSVALLWQKPQISLVDDFIAEQKHDDDLRKNVDDTASVTNNDRSYPVKPENVFGKYNP